MHAVFPCFEYLLRILIGSSYCLLLLWLVGVITLALGFQQSFENCSNSHWARWTIAFIIDRDNAKRLLYENDILQMQMSNSERDTLEVISFLKQEDSKKDEQVTNTNSVMTLRLNG